MLEVCLVLAPVVNFFLNSRKQGLPCWRSLSFFLSSMHYARKLVQTRHSLEHYPHLQTNQEKSAGSSARNPPDPPRSQ